MGKFIVDEVRHINFIFMYVFIKKNENMTANSVHVS